MVHLEEKKIHTNLYNDDGHKPQTQGKMNQEYYQKVMLLKY